jgi:hypothetical protein
MVSTNIQKGNMRIKLEDKFEMKLLKTRGKCMSISKLVVLLVLFLYSLLIISCPRASPATSSKASSKGIWDAPDKKNVPNRVPQSRFMSGAAQYGVRRPEPVPVT